ncbi:MAG: hypothetical protein PHU71_04340 [Candidatus Gracilibacteria bacterium]|nr:hypothetical protein [Candidatus Gracilibacteria bacterium]
MTLRLDWLLSRSVASPLETVNGDVFNWDFWLQDMRRHFGLPSLTATVFWPTSVERGRLYVHLLDEKGRPAAFAKISIALLATNNAKLLKEANAIYEIEARGLTTFRTPRVLMQGAIQNHSYLVLEPLSTSVRPIARKPQAYPNEAVKEYAGPIRFISSDVVPTLSWWGQYLNKLNDHSRIFHDEMMRYLQHSKISVCRAHGDLSSHNVVYDGSTLWIYDWEESTPDAPARADAIGFIIAMHQSAIRRNPVSWTKTLKKQYFGTVKYDHRADFMMALAFRYAVGIDDAALIIQNWSLCQGIERGKSLTVTVLVPWKM